jgi:hypothetical protein
VGVQPRVAAGDVIRSFNESNKSPYIKRQQTIFHPGEVQSVCWCCYLQVLSIPHSKQPTASIDVCLHRSTRSGRCRATSPFLSRIQMHQSCMSGAWSASQTVRRTGCVT